MNRAENVSLWPSKFNLIPKPRDLRGRDKHVKILDLERFQLETQPCTMAFFLSGNEILQKSDPLEVTKPEPDSNQTFWAKKLIPDCVQAYMYRTQWCRLLGKYRDAKSENFYEISMQWKRQHLCHIKSLSLILSPQPEWQMISPHDRRRGNLH